MIITTVHFLSLNVQVITFYMRMPTNIDFELEFLIFGSILYLFPLNQHYHSNANFKKFQVLVFFTTLSSSALKCTKALKGR